MLNTFMKRKSITRYASLLLAVGFFYACSSSAPTIDSLVSQDLYDEALLQIDQQLAENPDQPELYIQKGEIYLDLASSESVANREQHYQEAKGAFDTASELELTPNQSEKIDRLTTSSWTTELNTGTEIYEEGTLANSLEIALSHFDNAIILNPEDATAYLSKSVALYDSNELDEAIETLNLARNSLEDVPDRLYEYLGFLYLQNDDADQATFYYELANTDITADKNIAFGLVNIYILNQENEKAIDLLGTLAGVYPNDAPIKNVYGTQLFFIAENILNDLSDAYITNDLSLVDQLKFEAEGVGEQAEEELINAYELENTNNEYIQSLAVFYNNLTGMYLALAEIAPEEDSQNFIIKAETLLGFALQYYEKLASLNPGDAEISSSIEMLQQLQANRFGDSE